MKYQIQKKFSCAENSQTKLNLTKPKKILPNPKNPSQSQPKLTHPNQANLTNSQIN